MNRNVFIAASVMLSALVLGACGPTQVVDGGAEGGTDVVAPVDGGADAGGDVRADVRVDVGRPDAGASRAGSPCTDDTMCGTLTCNTMIPGGMCTADCENNASQAMEQAMCGGGGSTCLTQGDAMPVSLCTRACNAMATTTGCGMNQICTGFWFSHAGAMPDRAGCTFFCHADAECATGQRCSRLGSCEAMIPPMTNQPDGTYCNPMMDMPGMPSRQCRGACFLFSNTDRTQGICGSLVDTKRAAGGECPDGDPAVQWRAAGGGQTDNLGICIFRECVCDRDCGTTLRCVIGAMGAPGVCTFPNTAMGETGTPTCPAGGDAGTDSGSPVDSGPVDSGVSLPDVLPSLG